MKCEYCGYEGDGFEEGELGFWCPDCKGLYYKEEKEEYSQVDIILEKTNIISSPDHSKIKIKKAVVTIKISWGKIENDRSTAALYQRKEIFCRSFLWRS